MKLSIVQPRTSSKLDLRFLSLYPKPIRVDGRDIGSYICTEQASRSSYYAHGTRTREIKSSNPKRRRGSQLKGRARDKMGGKDNGVCVLFAGDGKG
ncbi:hypothetical protein PILCRDRAFT_810330 [Piloderma croceum F 1598]|uniref:Uncharacterized protein n=1 Tax=Piloderma croceum (strain F 1598) TaxID=765440 RepID=A0A0C3GL20_PILCF|nr:hypothetical protein PILCRDRAFT_810330 [Piloderma croceum F 1598]